MSESKVEQLAYVIDALRRQEARYRSNYWPVPSGVVELVEEIGSRVSRGHAGSSRADAGEYAEAVVVGGPLAVRYETAARMLEVSVSTIKRLIKAGELCPVAIGGSSRIRVADLDNYLSSRSEGA